MKSLIKCSKAPQTPGEAEGQEDIGLNTLELGLASMFSDCSKGGDDIWILNKPLCDRVYTDINCYIKF